MWFGVIVNVRLFVLIFFLVRSIATLLLLLLAIFCTSVFEPNLKFEVLGTTSHNTESSNHMQKPYGNHMEKGISAFRKVGNGPGVTELCDFFSHKNIKICRCEKTGQTFAVTKL